ncbi:MAG: hypothetical protein ACQEP1_01550 [Nanobdellota archaeon]
MGKVRKINSIKDELPGYGVYKVSIGAESANDGILRKIRKSHRSMHVEELFKNKPRELELKGFYMIGFPDETLEEVYNTVNQALRLPWDYIGINIVKLYPNTKMCEDFFGNDYMPRYKTSDGKYGGLMYDKVSKVNNEELIEIQNEAMRIFKNKKRTGNAHEIHNYRQHEAL